jgi:hypothetical protein
VDLTNLQVYMDRLYRSSAANTASEQAIIFDPALVQKVGRIDNVLGTFLEEQLLQLEDKLSQKGVSQTKGLPLEILFTLVTEDGTKQQMDPAGIRDSLPRNRKINDQQLEFCLAEFQRIRLLRPLGE